jgi:hypothetical protein
MKEGPRRASDQKALGEMRLAAYLSDKFGLNAPEKLSCAGSTVNLVTKGATGERATVGNVAGIRR